MLTVEEYLKYCAWLRHVANANPSLAVDRVMERCGIGCFRRRLIASLSDVFRQRTGIAQSIVHDPSVVVFDEPANVLDPIRLAVVRQLFFYKGILKQWNRR